MTVEEVRARIAEIQECSHDPEMAHSLEDKLYVDVLKAISDGADRAIAVQALATQSLDFARWCA